MKNILVFLLFFVSINLNAQKISWQNISRKAQKSYNHSLIKLDDHSFIDAELNKSTNASQKLELVKYNTETLKEEKRVKYKGMKGSRAYVTIMGVRRIGNNTYVLFVQREKDKKSATFYCEKIDPSTLKTLNRKALLKVGVKKQMGLFSGRTDVVDNFTYSIAPDHSKIVVVGRFDGKKKEPAQYKMVVYDQNMDEIWLKRFKFKGYVGSFLVDDVGNVVHRSNGGIVVYTENGETKQKFDFDLKDNYLSGRSMLWTTEPGTYNYLSFYQKRSNKNGLYRGYFFQQFNVNTETASAPKFHEFPKDFLYLGLSNKGKATQKMDKRRATKSGLLRDMPFRQSYYDKETGNTTISFEDYFRTEKTVLIETSRHQTSVLYHYKNIAILQLDKEGNLNWHHGICKDQVTGLDNNFKFFSFLLSKHDKAFYVLFNDIGGNTERRNKNEKPKRYKGKAKGKNKVVGYVVNNDGKMSKEKVFPFDKSLQIDTRLFRLDDDTVILFAKTRGKSKIGKLEF